MKGSQATINALTKRLVEEYTAIQQYAGHRAIMLNWGYQKFAAYIQERIDDETKHFNMLLARIMFLGGTPVAGLNLVTFGAMVGDMLTNDHLSEMSAINNYNDTIQLCIAEGDDDTRRLLESILADETEHLFDIETNLVQLAQVGQQNYLSLQV